MEKKKRKSLQGIFGSSSQEESNLDIPRKSLHPVTQDSPIHLMMNLDVSKMKKRLSLTETMNLSSLINVEYDENVTKNKKYHTLNIYVNDLTRKMEKNTYWLYNQKYYAFKFKIYAFSNEFAMKYIKEDSSKNDGNILLFYMNESNSLKDLKKYQSNITIKPSILVIDNTNHKYDQNEAILFKKKADELIILYMEISLKKDVKIRDSLAELFLKILK
eukprot:gene2815-4223_t